MKTLEEIRRFFQDDRFATEQGIVIDSVDGDSAVCSVELNPSHNNANGVVQGGLIFTLADFAFAVAVNNQECNTVTLNSTISFFKPPKGAKLTASAVCTHRTRSTCVYLIDVRDDLGTAVAQVTATGFIRTPR